MIRKCAGGAEKPLVHGKKARDSLEQIASEGAQSG